MVNFIVMGAIGVLLLWWLAETSEYLDGLLPRRGGGKRKRRRK